MPSWSSWNKADFRSDLPGVGDGEKKFCGELIALYGDAKILGSNSKFDILDSRGKKWEVKSVENRKFIRSCSNGSYAAAMFMNELTCIVKQGKAFMGVVRDSELKMRYVNFDQVLKFFDDLDEALMTRSVPPGALRGGTTKYPLDVTKAIWMCSRVINDISESFGRQAIDVMGTTVELSPRDIAAVCSIIGRECDPLMSCLKFVDHWCYFDPSRFENWITNNPISAKDSFDVDLLALVTQDGYEVIERADFDVRLRLYSVTQNRPVYRVLDML